MAINHSNGMTVFDDCEYAIDEADFLAGLHRVRYAVISLRSGFGVLPLSLAGKTETILEVISAPTAVCTENLEPEN